MPTLCVAVLVIVLQLACGDEAAVDPRGRVVLTRDGGRQEVVDSADVASALGERLPTGADLFRSALSAHLAAGPEALQPFAPPVIGPDGDELSPAVHEPAPAAPTADRPPIDPSGPELQPSSADESEGTLAAGAHLSRPRLAWLWADGDSEVERSDAGLHSVDGALGWRGTADESSLPAVGAHTVVVGLRRREDRLRAIKRELSGLPHVAPPSTLRMDAVDGTAELDLSSAHDDGLLTHAAFLRARNQAPVHGVAPTRGAVGCYLSHAALWREARHRAGPLLVLEDDARLRSGAEGVIRSSLTQVRCSASHSLASRLVCAHHPHRRIVQAPPDWSLILFGSATAAYGQFANAPVGALPLRRALVNAYGTFAYAVSPKVLAASPRALHASTTLTRLPAGRAHAVAGRAADEDAGGRVHRGAGGAVVAGGAVRAAGRLPGRHGARDPCGRRLDLVPRRAPVAPARVAAQ